MGRTWIIHSKYKIPIFDEDGNCTLYKFIAAFPLKINPKDDEYVKCLINIQNNMLMQVWLKRPFLEIVWGMNKESQSGYLLNKIKEMADDSEYYFVECESKTKVVK